MCERSYYQCNRDEIKPFLPSHYKYILEIGCAEGCFSCSLDPEAETWGCDPDASSAEKASRRLFRVLKGTYEEVVAEIPDNYFDLVICNDVIEHMPNHVFFLENIQKKMKPGAYLVGSVPNVRYYRVLRDLLFKKDWRYTWPGGILDQTHLRFFTQKSLTRTLEEAGFLVESIKGINAPRKKKLFVLLFSGILFGSQSDITYKQMAFRVKRR